MAEGMAVRTCWNLQDMKIPREVPGCHVRAQRSREDRRWRGTRKWVFFFFFLPPLRQSHPGNLTFHTARLSVSPRKPFPDENQSVEASQLPDKPCGQHQGPAANLPHSEATSSARQVKPSSTEPSYLLSSILQKVLLSLKKQDRSAHFLIQRLLRLPVWSCFVFFSFSFLVSCPPRGRQSDPVRQQVGDRKDERAININSPPRPPLCVLKYLIILGTAPLLRRPSQSGSLLQDHSCSCSMRALSSHTAVAAARGTGVSEEPPPPPPSPQRWQLQADTVAPLSRAGPSLSFYRSNFHSSSQRTPA